MVYRPASDLEYKLLTEMDTAAQGAASNVQTRGAGFGDPLYPLGGCLPPKGKRSQGFSLAVIRYPSGSAKTNARPNGLS
jgi:hypothetical protein